MPRIAPRPRVATTVVRLVAATALAATALPMAPSHAADTGTPPAFIGVLGGPGKASMYPSGLETTTTGDVVVADTALNRVSKYSKAGALLWTVGSYGAGTRQFNNPRDIGIDAGGSIYVADTANTRIVKLSSTGAWVASWKGPAGDSIASPIGISAKGSKIYVADGNAKKVRVFDPDGRQTATFGQNGACTFAALRDVDVDAAGNMYIANYTLHNILKLSPTGACLLSWGTKGEGDGQFAAPYGVAVKRDPVSGEQRVYVADSNNNRIQVFSDKGDFRAKMGGEGTNTQPGTFTQLRRVAVDAQGNVWGADLWGWRVERFDRTATGYVFAKQIGTTQPGLTDNRVFGEPRGIAFDKDGNLRIVDTIHHRVVRMTPSGSVRDACGLRGSEPGEFNWPRGVAVDPVSGDLWITDTKQYRLQVLKADCTAPVLLGAKGTGTAQFDWPMAIAIRSSDRTAWVADTNNDRITVWDIATRRQVKSFGTSGAGPGQFNQPRGIAVGPDGHVYVADRGNNRIVELADDGAGIRVESTLTAGLARPEGVAVDSQGRVYVADTQNNRLVVLGTDGSVLGTTSGPSGMKEPASVAVAPNGRIYVSDTYNDRVLAFAFGSSSDTTPPESTITAPAAGSTVAKPVTLTGTASDASGVAAVTWTVQDRATLKYWNAATSSWGALVWNPSTLSAPDATSTTWSARFAPPASTGSYILRARAKDTRNLLETTPPSARFSVAP